MAWHCRGLYRYQLEKIPNFQRSLSLTPILKKHCHNQYMRHSLQTSRKPSLYSKPMNQFVPIIDFASERGLSCVRGELDEKFKCQLAQSILFAVGYWNRWDGKWRVGKHGRVSCSEVISRMVYLLDWWRQSAPNRFVSSDTASFA